jgi:outer membrane protein insertion porin family
MREVNDSKRRLGASGLYLTDPTKGSPPTIALVKPGQADADDQDDEEKLANDPDRPRHHGGYRGQSPDPAPGERTVDVVYQFDSIADVRRAERQLGITLWPQSLPQPQLQPQPRAWSPLPPPSSDLNWQPANGPAPGSADPPLVIRGQYTGDGGFSRPEVESPLPAAGPTYTPAPAAPVDSPTPSQQPYSQQQQQYSQQQPYSQQQQQYSQQQQPYSQQPYLPPQQQSPVFTKVADPAPISSSGVTSAPWGVSGVDNGAAPGATAPATAPGPGTPYNYQPAPGPYQYPTTPPNGFQTPPSPPAPGPGGFVPPHSIFAPGGEPPPGGEPSWVQDIRIKMEEGQTGRFQVGVGVNSDAGLVGNIVLDEQNFNWARYPTSWEDVRDGTAWRGAGEHLRLEAYPGTEVQNYAVTYGQPYLFDFEGRAVSMTLNGFYYDRIYTDWTEGREGGRVGFGYQITHDLTASVGFRACNVNVCNPIVPTPQDLLDALGNHGLYGFQVSLAHKTVDSDYLATEGHLFQVSYEEVIGSYTYPHVEMEFTQYFKLAERLDRTGRQVLSLSARAGYTGSDTPIYDRYYAGGYSSLRGFEFRGVSPIDPATGVAIGGDFELLTTVQYMFPITQDDMLRGVFFVDSGTVEPTIDRWTDKYRVAPGFGLRIAIPAMGPAPIALDFGFPVVKQPGDTTQVFSFFVGFNR